MTEPRTIPRRAQGRADATTGVPGALNRAALGNRGGPSFYVYAAGLMDETLYDGLAHEAAFYVPTAGMVRFVLSPAGASAYVRGGPFLSCASQAVAAACSLACLRPARRCPKTRQIGPWRIRARLLPSYKKQC
jgi:hypothetical protein